MWENYVFLVIGFFLLVKGADWVVDGASSLAKRLGVSTLIIGLTVVAFGTSAPELVVNLIAAISGSSDVSLGNIIGSNIANVLLILGAAAVIFPLKVQYSTVWKEIPFGLLAAFTLFVVANDVVIDSASGTLLSRSEGILMLFFFVIYMYYAFELSRGTRVEDNGIEIKKMNMWKIIGLLIVGFTGLVVGGWLTVDRAVIIARSWGISEFVISATIVAIGTSFPELVTSIIAAKKGEVDLAVGNVVGSNIFNIFLVLALTSTISPIFNISKVNIDLLFLIATSFLLFVFMFIGEKHKLERWQGWVFLAGYVSYIVYLVGGAIF